MTLSGSANNTYSGGTTIAAGTVTSTTAGQFGTGALTLTAGALNINGNQQVTNFSGAASQTLTIGSGATLTDLGITGANSPSNVTYAGNTGTSAGNFVYGAAGVATTGTLSLTGTNSSWTGNTTINSGVISYNTASDAALGATAASITVNSGDSLWRISSKFYGEGMRYTVIYRANSGQIRDPNLIYPGQVFVVPNEKP